MLALGQKVDGPGTFYFTGGATALSFGWREKTIDEDIKADPEPRGFFEVIAEIKEALDTMSSWPVRICSFRNCLPGAREARLFAEFEMWISGISISTAKLWQSWSADTGAIFKMGGPLRIKNCWPSKSSRIFFRKFALHSKDSPRLMKRLLQNPWRIFVLHHDPFTC